MEKLNRVYQAGIDFESLEEMQDFLKWWDELGEDLYNGFLCKTIIENMIAEE